MIFLGTRETPDQIYGLRYTIIPDYTCDYSGISIQVLISSTSASTYPGITGCDEQNGVLCRTNNSQACYLTVVAAMRGTIVIVIGYGLNQIENFDSRYLIIIRAEFANRVNLDQSVSLTGVEPSVGPKHQ